MTRRYCPNTPRWAAGICAAVAAFVGPALHGYALIGSSWATGNVTLQLQLDATAPTNVTLPLRDGSTTWNSIAVSAANEWNTHLVRSKLVTTTSTSTAATEGDGVNNVFFSTTAYDNTFDQYTLAITVVDQVVEGGWPSIKTSETDLIVNKNRTWNAYQGPISSSPLDLRRVVLHEMGHVLGLDHPDKKVPAETVTAIMNSEISDRYVLQSDDITGITYLYGTALPVSAITTQPVSQTVAATSNTALSIGVNGSNTAPDAQPALLAYNWYFKAANASTFERLFTINAPRVDLGAVQVSDAGSYYVEVETPDGKVTSQTATLAVTPPTIASDTVLHNISTRGIAGSGSSTMIVGFVVTGSHPKSVLLRAVGPTLGGTFHVPGTLADPKLTLTTQSGTTLATSIDVWDQAANAAELRDTASRVGAFPLDAGSHDAVILTTVQPGNYTALATSASGNSGVVLVEAYDADAVRDPSSTLKNLSTRGYVGTGANVLIAGFSVQGPGPRTYLIRVSGPSLIPAPYNVTGTLPDPILTLFDNNSVKLRANDDWDSPAAKQPALNAAFTQVGAFSYKYPSTTNGVRDDTAMQPAMLVTLQPGNYTAQASGNDNNASTDPSGNALIEIYEMP